VDDETLIEQVQAGDRSAFEALMVAHHRRLFVLAFGILRDVHLAEDATQQAFFDIWRDIRQLRDPARFEAWSYRLLVRVCYREAGQRREQIAAIRMLSTVASPSPDPASPVVARDELERAFARLTVDHRVVIAMRYLLEMSPEQVGETLCLSRRTVYSRQKRALRAMRAALEAEARLAATTQGQPEASR
jgi:RNA polymerase sigma-70 factor, ECF subfamily